MKSIVYACLLIAVVWGNPIEEARVHLVQDTLGNYRLVYRNADSYREEQGFEGGKVVGTYGFLDNHGVYHEVKFVASKDGYLPEGDLPQPILDTFPVAVTRAAHLALLEYQYATLPKLEEN